MSSLFYLGLCNFFYEGGSHVMAYGIMAVFLLISYLIGSLNFGIIVSRVLGKEDVRQHGSGSAGMTNVLRTYGKGPAIATALGDFSKGILAILLVRHFGFQMFFLDYVAGLFVILGHVKPIFFGFKGGKGVLTTLGVMLALNPLVFLIIAVIFIPLAFITKIVSLCSVIGAISYPVITFIVDGIRHRSTLITTMFAAIYAIIILFMHRQNIKRLLSGTEYKFGEKK